MCRRSSTHHQQMQMVFSNRRGIDDGADARDALVDRKTRCYAPRPSNLCAGDCDHRARSSNCPWMSFMSVRLVFLGTGSGKPMPHRGVSSVALFRDGELLLFDCGESTQIQLSRSSLRPGPLAKIFLTHFHGDHVNGLPGLLGSLTLNQRDDALDVHGPAGLSRWFKCLRELRILWPGFPLHAREVEAGGVVATGEGYKVLAAPLKHRVDTWGYAYIEEARPGRFDVAAARGLGVPEGPLFGKLQAGQPVVLDDGRTVRPRDVLGPSRPGLKIAYCSDTVPCEGARELAEGADVLIHEATYPAGSEQKAHRRGHSTAADAARCARDAGAKRLILTHISQKYTNLSQFVAPARKIFEETIVAHDLMEVPVKRRDS